MKVQAKSFDEYFDKADGRGSALRKLDEVIKRSAPHLDPVLFSMNGMGGGTVLGYGLQPYQSKSMKKPSVWPIILLANQKNYISLYICAVEDGEYIAEKNAARLGKVNCGKSCIRFKNIEDLNLSVIEELIRDIDRRTIAGEKLFGI